MTGMRLPEYPWESLAPVKARAASHPGGLIDLSIGTPVDPTPTVVRAALAAAADAPGYPTTVGRPELRVAIASWYARRRAASAVDPERGSLPTIGSKELVAWLPTLLAPGRENPGKAVIAYPSVAYPTYDMGAQIAGLQSRTLDAADVLAGADLSDVALLWINTPGNPDGSVLDVETLRALVAATRAAGVVLASDECYAELGWPAATGIAPEVPSILSDEVTDGDLTGLLSVYSLSKQSNLAGYRAAFVAGDPALVADLTNTRKQAGMIVPAPIQAAVIAALGDDEHVAAQKARYAARRAALLPRVEGFGLRVDRSEAGLYLWATRDEDCWDTLDVLAGLGILAAPGTFYGARSGRHVRIALTATDEAIAAAAERLAAAGG